MAQKAHSNILRPTESLYQGCTHWDEARFYHISSRVDCLINSCCAGTNNYVSNIKINRHLGLVFLELDLVHLQYLPKERRFNPKNKSQEVIESKPSEGSWIHLLFRLNRSLRVIQTFTGTKKVTLRINRLKTYTRATPKKVRKQLAHYTKPHFKLKYDYARYGMQLMDLIVKNKGSARALSRFLEQNIRTRRKRKRHQEFLGYIRQGFEALKPYRKIQGLKIQIKGRFTLKAKGRTRVWKYQMGQMPLSQLDIPIQTEYTQTKTAYGSVGLKVWIATQDLA
uniref:Ribosomal protein S3 n=1 Tax=Phaeophyceae sp. TaxID=2249243 RepID=A0A8E8PFF9_9PHAE|nr:ribosomal protein S3 [Phaeophyceae sp.]